MTTWVIISWIFVAVFTAVNVVIFLKLKKASEQMMKMAFPGAKDMNQAMAQMQSMMSGMGGGKGGNANAQMKMAMDMLAQMKGPKGGGKPRR